MSESAGTEGGSGRPLLELRDLVVRSISVSSMDNDVYLLTCRATGEQLLVDAADEAGRVLALAREGAAAHGVGDGAGDAGLLHTVVTTHQHWDHHRALPDVLAATRARSAAGEDDADALPVAPDLRLRHGDEVRFGRIALRVVHLRGHTPGSVALAYEDSDGPVQLWTGDSLFPGGVGNTQGDPARFRQLVDDVAERVFGVYGDDTRVHPGHGRGTTLGAERPHLPLWRSRGW